MSSEVKIILSAIDNASKVFGNVSGSTDKMRGTFEKLKGALIPVGLTAAGAIAALGGALKFSIGAAIEGQRTMAQTEAAIKATGGAAGLTAKQVVDLAESEAFLTGIDDDVIQSGANMLLTFKQIGGSVFPRATRAMEDMAVAMASGDVSAIDLKGTAIQLGKALNDPIEGLSALTRVGVTFTQAQKDQIRAMQEAGNVAGAQGVILTELESEFGGAAEAAGQTFTGELGKAKVAVGMLASELGMVLLPALTNTAKGLTELTKIQMAAIKIADEQDVRYKRAAVQMAIVADAEDKVKARLDEANDALLRQSGSWNRTTESMGAANSKTEILTGGLYDARKAMEASIISIGGLEGRLNDLKGTTLTASEMLQGYTETLLFNQVAANLDAESALALGRAMGLVDERTVEAIDGVAELTQKFDLNQDGVIDAEEATLDYILAVMALRKNIEEMPDLKTIRIRTILEGGGGGLSGGAPTLPASGTPRRRQHGGDVSAGMPYWVGEREPELFIPRISGAIVPGERVTVAPQRQSGLDEELKMMIAALPGEIRRAVRDGTVKAIG